MKLSRRLDQLKPYVFVEISRIIAKKRAEGVEGGTFGLGDPDIHTTTPSLHPPVPASPPAP